MNPTFQRYVAPGLEIRQFQEADAAAVFELVERNRAYLREWLPWVANTHSPADIRGFILRTLARWNAGQGPDCAIWAGGAIIGCIGTHPIDWGNHNCSIGYWLDGAQQGKGIVTRCCSSLIDYLFFELGLHRVEIRCGAGNHRSCAIPRRLGFAREGVLAEAECVDGRWVDLVVWGMLQSNWRANENV